MCRRNHLQNYPVECLLVLISGGRKLLRAHQYFTRTCYTAVVYSDCTVIWSFNVYTNTKIARTQSLWGWSFPPSTHDCYSVLDWLPALLSTKSLPPALSLFSPLCLHMSSHVSWPGGFLSEVLTFA